MKQLITPIAIVVALVVFFIIIDRKEFRSHDDVQTVQSENSTSNRKPLVSVPEAKPVNEWKDTVETKPIAETKPIVETKPAEGKPVTEAKSKTDMKLTETKPPRQSSYPKPNQLQKTMPEKATPVAVPIATAAEADQLNEFALFLSNVRMKTTVVEGEILERSELPDPRQSDYPDCRFTVHLNGNIIKSGEPCFKEISLIIEGFTKYHILPSNDIQAGDKVLCTILPFDQIPDDYQSIYIADDLNLYFLNCYYVLEIQRIDAYADGDNAYNPLSGVYFLNGNQEYVSIYNQHINPPIPREVQEAQARAISHDLNEIDELLKGYDAETIKEINSAFSHAWKVEQTKYTSGHNVIEAGKNKSQFIWKQIDNSFYTLSPSISNLISMRLISNENLEAIIELKKALEENGVQMILSIIQDREPIVARIINPDFRNIPDYETYSNIHILLKHGIEAVSPSKESVQRFNEEEFVYNVGDDKHPSVLVQKIASEILTNRLERYGIPKRLKQELFCLREETHLFYGDEPLATYPDNCDIGSHKPGERIKAIKPVLPKEYSYTNKDSEVLVIGNSFSWSPYYNDGGLVTWLDYNLETNVSYYSYPGNGPETVFIRNLLSAPEKYLKGKKVVVIQLTTGNIVGSSWYNICMLDQQLTTLCSHKLVSTIPVQQQDGISPGVTSDNRLKGFSFIIDDDVLEISNSTIETNNEKSLIVIPACLVSGEVFITVNGVSKKIPATPYATESFYHTLIFELPTDTNEISVSVKGKKQSFFVIRDIELWQ